MAIKLEVEPYCEQCLDFETVWSITPSSATTIQSDTVIRCRYANRCANLMRYLNKQHKGE